MRHYTTVVPNEPILRHLFTGLLRLALLGMVLLPWWGVIPEGYAGWLTDPPILYGNRPETKRVRSPGASWRHVHWRGAWGYAGRRLSRAAYQMGLLLLVSAPLSLGAWGWGVLLLPLMRWGVAVSGVAWPWWGESVACRGLRQVLYRCYQLSVLVLVGASLYQLGRPLWEPSPLLEQEIAPLVLGGVVKRAAKGWQVSIEESDDGVVKITLEGPKGDCWFIRYRPVDEFDRRMLINVVRHIWTPEDTPKRPFLRQEWLAAGFETYQELISRWQRYRREGDWRRMMSRRGGELLTLDQIEEIVDVWTRALWWTVEEVWDHMAEQGKAYSLSQVREAGRLSGFLRVRRRLRERFKIGPEAVKPKDEWLVARLFEQNEMLLEKVEGVEGLTPEERLGLGTLQAQRKELGLGTGRELKKPLPWMYRMQHILFGWWEEVEDKRVRCTYCGSTQVAQKSETPRPKLYYDRERNLREVAVYRYYCHNPACEHTTFSDLPKDLIPHSPWPIGARLQVMQGYGWARSTYRRVGQGVGVSTATAYRWVSAWGKDLLPMAALFGVVRSSGVVGVDEKWVKVPKNDKPEGRRKKWMYVYLAVDVYTYDLLHIAISPYLTRASARAFLSALRVKGYTPRVIITDLRHDYGEVVAEVFPKARHHECIFHALKWIQRKIKEVYGGDYRDECPEAVALKEAIYAIFQCKDKRTSRRRYAQVMKKRQRCIEEEPEAAIIFDSLESHWPKLVNAMGSKVIPKTNNAVELVIRRFDQHYQNFCGFDTIETAQCYLAVFELIYRFTPFAEYNRKDKERPPDQRIGGKCPLEVAGYDVETLPIAQIFRGRILGWPDEALGELVPYV